MLVLMERMLFVVGSEAGTIATSSGFVTGRRSPCRTKRQTRPRAGVAWKWLATSRNGILSHMRQSLVGPARINFISHTGSAASLGTIRLCLGFWQRGITLGDLKSLSAFALNFQHLQNGGRDAVGNFEADDIVFEHLLSEQRKPFARAIEFLGNKERAAIAFLEHVLHAGVNGLRFTKKIRRERNMLGLGIDMKRGHFAVFFEFVIEECLQ
jgi:hypothetical protein